jgi:motility quorum-sensing regulator / GCU-specific mRNA interferase toxin
MEKRSPHYKLSTIKATIRSGKVRITFSALAGGAALGFDAEGIIETVMELKTKNFYKSMTTHGDPRVWQDVYRPVTSAGEVYLKLSFIDDVLIVSFKEL